MFPDWQYLTICVSESCQQAELIPLLVLGPEMKLDIYLIELIIRPYLNITSTLYKVSCSPK